MTPLEILSEALSGTDKRAELCEGVATTLIKTQQELIDTRFVFRSPTPFEKVRGMQLFYLAAAIDVCSQQLRAPLFSAITGESHPMVEHLKHLIEARHDLQQLEGFCRSCVSRNLARIESGKAFECQIRTSKQSGDQMQYFLDERGTISTRGAK